MTTPKRAKPGLMRSLGLFIHNIGKGAATPAGKSTPPNGPNGPGGPVLRRTTTDQRVEQTPAGPVVVKRTTVDEIQLPPGATVDLSREAPRGVNPPADRTS